MKGLLKDGKVKHELRVELRVYIYQLQVQKHELQKLKAAVARLNEQGRKLKAGVKAIKPQVKVK